ncbi:hypothetical protein R3W88_008026 [Solanum pinnatisectum]|uniref:Uncharacterized protein n=1 Tax=Solanum pinnatisectum TaxID=50273 RepID=A0AAV9M6R7_9SOLN|nr:hypothetical protein R3W88_008026 [Solanum pinnatisectum]
MKEQEIVSGNKNGTYHNGEEVQLTNIHINVAQGINQSQYDQQDNTNLEVIDVDSSSHFSFGVRPAGSLTISEEQQRNGTDINTNNVLSCTQLQGQKTKGSSLQIKTASDEANHTGKSSPHNPSHNVDHRDNEVSQKISKANEQRANKLSIQEQVDKENYGQQQGIQQVNNCDRVELNKYHNDFPKISSNFEKHTAGTLNIKQNNQNQQAMGTSNKEGNHQDQNKQDHARKGYKDANNNTGIDSMLPTPETLNINSTEIVHNNEANGWMEGGSQENHTNLQEGVSKGGYLPHVLHEGNHFDFNPDLRALATTKGSQQKSRDQQRQQQNQETTQNQTEEDNNEEIQQKVKNAQGDQKKGSMAKDMGAKASTSKQVSTSKSKNKPSKKKRESTKKKQNRQQEGEQQKEQEKKEEECKKFIMVDDEQGMDITPLQAQYISPTPKNPPDTGQGNCQINSIPIIDEYAVENSEDELDRDNQSLKDQEEEEESGERLIELWSNYNQALEEEIQQVTNNQGLSPRGLHHDRFHF